MKNTNLQERLFSEPRDDSEEALKFAIAFDKAVQKIKQLVQEGRLPSKKVPSWLLNRIKTVTSVVPNSYWGTNGIARPKILSAEGAEKWDILLDYARKR